MSHVIPISLTANDCVYIVLHAAISRPQETHHWKDRKLSLALNWSSRLRVPCSSSTLKGYRTYSTDRQLFQPLLVPSNAKFTLRTLPDDEAKKVSPPS